MKRSLLPFLLSVLALVAQSATAQILYDNSNIQTGTGNGFRGANTSSIAAGSTTFGFGVNGTGATPGPARGSIHPLLGLADQFHLVCRLLTHFVSIA